IGRRPAPVIERDPASGPASAPGSYPGGAYGSEPGAAPTAAHDLCVDLPDRGVRGQTRWGGVAVRGLTGRWGVGGGAVGSGGAGALSLAYVDRHQVPAGLTAWDFSNVFGGVMNLAVPVVGFVLASRRPSNLVGWLLLVGSLALGLGGFASAYALHALIADPGS